MINPQSKILVAGDLAVATNYNDSRVFSLLDSSNINSSKNLFEQFAFQTIGHVRDFEVTHQLTDDVKITVDNCNVWDIDLAAKKIPKISFNWLDVNDLDTFARVFGMVNASVANTTVTGFSQVVVSGDWNKNVFIALSNQNGNGAAQTITSVTGSVTGAITAGASGYVLSQDALGRYGITIQTGFAGAIAQNITIVYNYTPYAQQLVGYSTGLANIPFQLFRFRSCVQDNTVAGVAASARNTVYFVKFSLSAEMLEQYINRNRSEFAGTNMEFTAADWGFYLKVKETR